MEDKAYINWENIHQYHALKDIKYDNWLDIFKNVINNCTDPIIDLGCGSGNDTLYLSELKKDVIPCDYSKNAINNIKNNFPNLIDYKCFDMRDNFPFDDNYTSLIICDLSIHYFDEKTTFKILNEVKRVLKKDGILLLRVNSIKEKVNEDDLGKEIENNYYLLPDGRYKRYFDKDVFNYLFKDWNIKYLKEDTTYRYGKCKYLWVCEVENNK